MYKAQMAGKLLVEGIGMRILRFTGLFLLLILWCSLTTPEAQTIVGGLEERSCLGGWCPPSNYWAAVVTGSGAAMAVKMQEAHYQPLYEGHTFFPDGRSVLVATDSDCYNDYSYEECLIVAVFDPNGSLIRKKTFISTYRQTDPSSGIIDNSMFDVVDVSTWGDKIVIGFELPPNELLILDSNLNIVAQLELPSTPVVLAGPWAILYDRTVLDLETGKLYEDPYKELIPYHGVTEAVPIDGGLAVFYSAPTGLGLELYTFAFMVKRDGEKLKTVKAVRLNFDGDGVLMGAPVIMNASKGSSGWTIHVKSWHDFGGNEDHGIIVADTNWENFRAYVVRGADKRYWENFSLDKMGDMSDSGGSLYLPLSTGGKSAALVDLKALPLKEDNAMSVIYWGGEKVWESVSESHIQSVSYVTECGRCTPSSVESLDTTIGVVQQPTMFYLNTNPVDQSLFADLFCYGPIGYKTYCGVIINDQIWLYDAGSGTFVPFDPSRMDDYQALSNSGDPNVIVQVKVCDGAQPTLPPLNVSLFAVSVPEGMNLSSALEKGDYLITTLPWRTPDCM